MSLFAHNQGFQIHGGNFYNVAGGLNIECPLPLPVTGDPAHSAGVQEDWGLDGTTASNPIGIPHAPTSGVHRNTQERSGARHHPYSTSGRPQIDWHPPEPAGLPEERMSEQINDVGSWEAASGTLISVEKAMNLSRENSREVPHKSAGIGYLLNSVSDSRLDTASSLRGGGVRCDSSEPPQRNGEANGSRSARGPVRHSYESVPPARPSRHLGPSEMTTTINGGTFVSNNIHRGERGIDLLHSAVALAAIYDSAESFPQPKCHPETRMKMLENLRQWSLETDPRSTILWLHGPAGAGKSAIMQTLARELQNVGRLGGSFFFKRGHVTCGNGKTLFATIAYQLALGISWLKAPISNTVEDDPSIIARSIEIQLQKLISEPCHLHNVGGTWDPITVVIDGLDECEGQDVQEEILCAVRNCTAEYNLPLRFIIASRPEPHISDIFQSPFYEGCYKLFNVVQSFDDVRKYLRDEFARIHREHRNTMANIPLPWPSPDVLEQLVWESSGHFIYASTIIKFVNDKNYRPTERLAIVQQQDIVQSCSAFDPIDQLYMIILCSSPRQAQLIPILCAIANFSLAPDIIDQLCGLAPGDTRLLLRGLHSVLKVPEDLDDDDFPTILTHHASFVDFLKNQRRSQQFYVDGLHHRMDLARAFLKLCAGQYRSLNYAEKDFIPLLTSLPPSTELLAPIQVMNPDYIFGLNPPVNSLLPWLKAIPSVPPEFLNLWEDYAYILELAKAAQGEPEMALFSGLHIVSHVPELLPTLVAIVLGYVVNEPLRHIRAVLGFTWEKFREIMCSFRPNVAGDETISRARFVDVSFPEAHPWPTVARDLARRHIYLIKCTEAGNLPEEIYIGYLLWDLPFLVRASPPCPELYRDLWSIGPILPLLGYDMQEFIYHVSKWVESFSDPTLELIAFWRQCMSSAEKASNVAGDSPEYSQRMEDVWRECIKKLDDTFTGRRFPSTTRSS